MCVQTSCMLVDMITIAILLISTGYKLVVGLFFIGLIFFLLEAVSNSFLNYWTLFWPIFVCGLKLSSYKTKNS